MTDRFEELRTYIAVVEAQGFGAAAERLGLAKSAVSRRISALEQRLNVRLLTRTTRQLKMTEAGENFYRTALKLLELMRTAEEDVGQGAHHAVGHLRVSAPVSFTAHCLAPLLNKFLTQHPNLTLEIETDDKIVDIVRQGYDLAIRISNLKDSSLIAKKITTIRHAACASPDYLDKWGRPSTFKELISHQGIVYVYSDLQASWRFDNSNVVLPQSRLFMNNGEAIREAAIAGCGIAVLPTFIIYHAVERGELEVLRPDFNREAMTMYAVFPSNRHLSAKIRLFIEFLLDEFRIEPFWDRILFEAAEK